MGKRKLHDKTIYYCDWTGYPMKNSGCYMPSWNDNTKLTKKGNYCNWESVLAHAHHLSNVTNSMSYEELCNVNEHIEQLIGPLPDPDRFHFSTLEHFKEGGDLSLEGYLTECDHMIEEISAVKINPSGDIFEVIMDPMNGKFDFPNYLNRPYMYQGSQHGLTIVNAMRKGKANKDKDLLLMYWPGKNGLPFNTTASNIFKVHIHGDVLLVQQSRETAIRPRERYINFTKVDFEDFYARKRKRQTQDQKTTALTTQEFEVLKQGMSSSLNVFEAHASSEAQLPQDLARGAVMPQPSGKELSVVARDILGHEVPSKRFVDEE